MTTKNIQSRVVIRPRVPVFVSAERTVLSTAGDQYDRTSEVTVALLLTEDESGRHIVRMSGGPTGREAFELTPYTVRLLQDRSWVASRGERGSVDRLVVPSRQLRHAFASWGVEVEGEVTEAAA